MKLRIYPNLTFSIFPTFFIFFMNIGHHRGFGRECQQRRAHAGVKSQHLVEPQIFFRETLDAHPTLLYSPAMSTNLIDKFGNIGTREARRGSDNGSAKRGDDRSGHVPQGPSGGLWEPAHPD